jgi:hypothetical protein
MAAGKLGILDAVVRDMLAIEDEHLVLHNAEDELLAVMDGPLAVEDGMDVDDGLLMPGVVPDYLALPSISLGGKTVRFDGCSHQSGLQRAYITCCRTGVHKGCHKYRYLRDFGNDRRRAAAWLMAWDAYAHKVENRHQHYAVEPTPQNVAWAFAKFPP